jgi:hypothetical protein
MLRIEGRDAHQTVDSLLGLQVTEREIARHRDRGAADSRFLARLQVQDLRAVTVSLGPAQIHPEHHFRPVAGVRAAGAGVHRDDRVRGVVFAAEQLPELGGVDLALRVAELLLRLHPRRRVVGLGGQLDQDLGVVQLFGQPIEELDLALCRALFAQDPLGAPAILPQTRPRRFALESRGALAQGVEVKAAPGARKSERAARADVPRARHSRSPPDWMSRSCPPLVTRS